MYNKKSRTKNNLKRYRSKNRKMLTGGNLIKPTEDEMLINLNKDYINYMYTNFNIFKNQECPHLIKFNDNINIISIHSYNVLNLDKILLERIENNCTEIINHPSAGEHIYFLHNEENFECLDFTTLFQNSYEKSCDPKKFYQTCQNEIGFPFIVFFYCEALKLSYWQKIYDDCQLHGRKLNIFTFHLGTIQDHIEVQQKIIKHFIFFSFFN